MPNPKQYLQKEIIPGNNLSWDTDGVTLNADVPSIEANPQETSTDTLESLEIDGTVYDLGGGTEVEANPSDPATDTLSSIDIDGTVYDLGGGTEVEANPSDPATDTLSTIDIAGTVYSIEGGGGGGISYDYYLQDGNIGGGPGSSAYATVPLDKTLTEGVYIAYTIDSNGTTGNTFFTWGGTNKSLTTGSITYTLSATAATATNYSGNWRDIFLTIFKLNSGGGTGGGGFSAPDYENPETITLVLNTWVTYNVTENGYIMVDLTAFTETGGTSVKVNGTTLSFDKTGATNYILNSTYMFPVMKDDVVEIRLNYNNTGYAGNTALFFPAKNSGGGGGGTGNLNAVEMDYEDWLALPQEEREDPTIEYFLSNAPGGGGSGSGYEEEQIYLATSTSFSNITVDWDWNNYDAYVFRPWDAIASNQSGDSTFLTKQQVLDAISNNVPQYFTNSYGYASYNISASTLTTVNHSNSMFMQEIVGIKFGSGSGGGGDLSAYELTQNQYNNLPTAQKLDEKELYFINNNITTEEAIDVTDFVNKVESGGAMTITADATNNTLSYVWGGASTIGANSFYPTAISSNATRIDYKITTGTSYTTSDDQFKIGIGVKTTYDATNWAKPTDNNWVAIDVYNTQNTVIEGSLDLSEVDEDTYFYICGHGWNMTIEDLTIVTVNESTDPTKIMYKDVEYGSGGGSGGGNLYGTTDPASDLGNNGDIYMKYGHRYVNTSFISSTTSIPWGSTLDVTITDMDTYDSLHIEGKCMIGGYGNQPFDEEWVVDDIPSDSSTAVRVTANSDCFMYRDGDTLKFYNTVTAGVIDSLEGAKADAPYIVGEYGKIEGAWCNFPEHTYSTAEQVVGTWVDGKPIYELTVAKAVNFPGSNTWKTLDIAMSTYNIKQIFDVTIVGTENTGNVPALLHPESVEPIDGYICVYHNFNWNMTSSHIILRYTKTTD